MRGAAVKQEIQILIKQFVNLNGLVSFENFPNTGSWWPSNRKRTPKRSDKVTAKAAFPQISQDIECFRSCRIALEPETKSSLSLRVLKRLCV